jgi:hypothetical protein
MRWLTSAVLTAAVLVALTGSCKAQPADLNAILGQFNQYFAAGDYCAAPC